jgi:hypothetical protein
VARGALHEVAQQRLVRRRDLPDRGVIDPGAAPPVRDHARRGRERGAEPAVQRTLGRLREAAAPGEQRHGGEHGAARTVGGRARPASPAAAVRHAPPAPSLASTS